MGYKLTEDDLNLFHQQGWLRIRAQKINNKEFYLVKRLALSPPGDRLPKITIEEFDAVLDLALEEIELLIVAKEIFGGKLSVVS